MEGGNIENSQSEDINRSNVPEKPGHRIYTTEPSLSSDSSTSETPGLRNSVNPPASPAQANHAGHFQSSKECAERPRSR